MLRIARLTDYGLVLLTHMASRSGSDRRIFSCRELAAETRLPLPTVSKVLKTMSQGGLVVSHRGVAGGYSLARAAEQISVADVITAIEGPVALTLCSDPEGHCEIEGSCPDRTNMKRINDVIRNALAAIPLSDMSRPRALITLNAPAAPRASTNEGGHSSW